MPTPLELLSDPVSLASFALYASMLAWEALAPAGPQLHVRGWWARGLASFAAFFFVSSYLPLLLSDRLAALRIFDGSELGTVGGGLLALFLYELLVYGYHRAVHASDALFRVFHQLHHSAERLDVLGAFWFSPWDMVGFTLLSALALSVVGVTPAATTLFLLATMLLSTFQHTNVKTPRWLGYLVQRPESHSHHHARGVHRDNYADLPVIDLVFGTFTNPAEFAPEHGYYDGASGRVLDMLACREVSTPARSSRISLLVKTAS